MKRYASFQVLSTTLVPPAVQGSTRIQTHGHRAVFQYEARPGFLYVRSRAISSRCNDNYDEFPASEIEKGYRTFIGKPVFVNHHNEDHRRARGVVVDAVLHKDANPDGSPDTWCEVLMEVDAMKFPKLAAAIMADPPQIDRTSMGCDVEYSLCSFCGNKAYTPLDYCAHIPRLKGQRIRRVTASGEREDVLVREVCYGLSFFENSLLVEEPADPTAYFLGVDDTGVRAVMAKAATRHTANGYEQRVVAPAQVDTMRDEECPVCGEKDSFDSSRCQVCGYEVPPDFLQDPDTEVAQQVDLHQDQAQGGEEPGPEDVVNPEGGGEDAEDRQAEVDEQGNPVVVEEGAPKVDAAGNPVVDPNDPNAPLPGEAPVPDGKFEEAPVDANGRPVEDPARPTKGQEQPHEVAPAKAPFEEAPAEPVATDQPVKEKPKFEDAGDHAPVDKKPTGDTESKPPSDDDEDDDDKGKKKPPPWVKKKESKMEGQGQMSPALRAIAEQQTKLDRQDGIIKRQAQMIGSLHRHRTATQKRLKAMEVFLSRLAMRTGMSADEYRNEVTASMKIADIDNPAQPIPDGPSEGAGVMSTEEAITPDAKDDVMNVGGVPGASDVSPDLKTSVEPVGGVMPAPQPDEVVDPTKPVEGTTDQRPLSETKTEIQPETLNNPDQTPANPIDPSGPFSERMTTGSARMTASLRLARLRIAVGTAQGVTGEDADIALAQHISLDQSMTADKIAQEISVLEQVRQASASRAPERVIAAGTNGEGAGRAMPSLASVAVRTGYEYGDAAPTGDEFLFE